jgi:hypothetical protein
MTNKGAVMQHTVSKSRAEQYRQMQKMLDAGPFVLTGFVIVDAENIQPVSFTYGVHPDYAEAVNSMTKGAALSLFAGMKAVVEQETEN